MPATRTLPQVKQVNCTPSSSVGSNDDDTKNIPTPPSNQPLISIPSAANQKLLRTPSRKSDRPGRPRENLAVANQPSPTQDTRRQKVPTAGLDKSHLCTCQYHRRTHVKF
ncbi:hypothetical protein V496_04988 [Pseudogymnoascus sp. VKM F-4515 (FW-2607)]|nr:hypothetical protein V496_04988 [Pseudogymnoascus sp. VKM F-4515 (FW-2607)]